jgi:carboxypeptidase T
MKRSPFALVLTLLLLLALGQPALSAEPTHDLILLKLDSPAAESFLQENRNTLDITLVKPGQAAEIAVTAETMELIRQSGLEYEVRIKNLEEHYASRQSLKGAGFGVYHTYSESVAFVDSLRLLYPNVISEKWSIGQTHEGRDIWAFKVSDNPDMDENEPEVLLDGMHHAREIMAGEFVIMFAEYLAQNYGTDPEITWLVDNRELYLVPMVCPDGIVYNEQTNPDGGGMWRKNRRVNGDGSYGVDLNRNYPYEWGYDNSGSSPDPSSLVYRGPSPGSEPETQALMAFINSREFITQDTIHTYSNLLLYPWGYADIPAPHDAAFEHMAVEMTRFNGYVYGRPAGAINYTANGGTTDWAYGATGEHDLIYSFSSEIGAASDGFWPSESRRGPLFQENIWPHIYLMRAAGSYLACSDPVATGQSGNIAPGESGFLDFTIQNQSANTSAMNVSLVISTDDPWVQFGAATVNVGALSSLSNTTLGASAIPIDVDDNCPDGHVVEFSVVASQGDDQFTDTLSFMVGQPVSLFADNFESGLSGWVTTGLWATTTSTSHSPNHSLTDSPGANYGNYWAHTATTAQAYPASELRFWHRYAIEEDWDYGRVQVSTDGSSFTSLISFTGFENTWTEQVVDLSAYAGQDVYIRFLLDTDTYVVEDGWYIDDVQILGAGSENLPPPTPEFALETDLPKSEAVSVFNVDDPEGAPVVYGFFLYTDELCTQLEAKAIDMAEGSGEVTTWNLPPVAPGTYYVRAYASDGEQRSLLNEAMPLVVSNVGATDDMVISGPTLRVLDRVNGGSARVQLNVPGSAKVSLDIYDLRGAKIRSLFQGQMDAGTMVLTWDGRDDSGRHTASGVYFLRMKADNEVATGRMVVVR